ncbi:MAG TPA: tRNA lysidine(34) synthetase TilS [Candidatus Kapabacteria bacterium]|nr:tRNA lysidine(34) synthetase TilS [Candidatus Kapabacteria bacterium]
MARSKRSIESEALQVLHYAGVMKEDSVLVALSGGVDSVVLTAVLRKLQKKKYFKRLAIAHLNHTLRGTDAEKDAAFVERYAKQLGIDYFGERVDVRGFAKKNKLGIEEAGRELRYDFFERICKRDHFGFVVTAHHADDRIETILMNIARGTGLRGLAGIPKMRVLTDDIRIIRPLLEVPRDEIISFAKKNKLRWREDTSNTSDEYTRNRIRKYVVPALKKSVHGHDLYPAVSHLVKSVEDAESFIAYEASKVRSRALVKSTHPFFKNLPRREFKLNVLENVPSVVVRELLVREFEALVAYPVSISSDQWKNMVAVISQSGPRTLQLSKQLFLSHNKNILTLESSLPVKELHEAIMIGRSVETAIGNISLSRTKRNVVSRNANICMLSSVLFESHGLIVRNWKPADRIRPFGMNGTRLVSDLLSESGVKTEALKRRFPLVVLADSPNTVIWIPGIRASERCRIGSTFETGLVLRRKPI